MNLKIILMAAMAGSVLTTPPAMAQQRKTLLDVLFPKVYEKRMAKKRRAAQARQHAAQVGKQKKRAKVVRKLPKVSTSKNYAYKLPARSLIKLVAAPVVLAAVSNTQEGAAQDTSDAVTAKIGPMTRDITLAKNLKLTTEKHLATAISEFYKEHQEYIWVKDDGSWSAKARSVAKVLKSADEYGLNPNDYSVDLPLDNAIQADDDVSKAADMASQRLKLEMAMTNAVLRYAMDASFGTVNPNRLSGYHDFPVHYGQAGDLLEKAILKGLPANTLKTFHPQNKKFEALRAELAELQGASDDLIDLNTKVLIKPGQTNPEFPKILAAIKKRGSAELKQKHSALLNALPYPQAYAKEMVGLIKDYQKEAGLGADGIIGSKTASKLAGIPSSSKIDRVELAMERLRWLPHQFGTRHVFINAPEYRARYIESGAEKLSMRVVVGKKSNQTNFFYDEIEHVEYNPYWNVPRSIIVNEFLPKSINNPGYLDSRGYEVRTFGGKPLSSSSVNWYSVGQSPKFAVRQPPGPKNALGELKIMFPNKHAIYMHDTPAKSLFKRQKRAFSHGCVRLHDPKAMAAAVMGTSKARIQSRIAQGKNLQEKLPSKVPVYVSYFTAWPQEDGTVKYFTDVYGRDSHLMKAMKLTRKARETSISS